MKPSSLSKESRDAESFASQLKDVISPANPGSARRPLPRKVMPKTLHPGGRLVRYQFYSNPLFNGRALYPILRESPATLGRKTLNQTHFCLYLSLPRAHDYGSRLWIQTDWQTDSFVFMLSSPPKQISTPNSSVNLTLRSSFIHEQHTWTLQLRALQT